jgi:KipI family sensor histidine kinase inhibitor
VTAFPPIVPLGESALLVTFGDRIDRSLNARAREFADAVRAARAANPAIGAPVAAYASVLVPFDALAMDFEAARATVATLLGSSPGDAGGAAPVEPPGQTREVHVRYGGDDGPDLADVAALNDLSVSNVIDLHAATTYDVFFLGFAPGFAYLGTLPEKLRTPRLDRPRERVPAGSVGIAGEQTGVYPFALPGGWRIIGRTDALLWAPDRDPPALLRPGDRVRFVPMR